MVGELLLHRHHLLLLSLILLLSLQPTAQPNSFQLLLLLPSLQQELVEVVEGDHHLLVGQVVAEVLH